MGSIGSGAQDAFGIYGGVNSGSPVGYANAAIDTGKLVNQVAGKGTIPGVGAAGDALGIYSGLTNGGVGGYTSAAIDAYKLYNTVGSLGSAGATAGSTAGTAASAAGSTAASTIGAYIPAVGMLLSAYLNSQSPAYMMGPSWYKKINSALQAGPGATVNKSSPFYYGNHAQQQQEYDYFSALNQVQGEKGYEGIKLGTPASSIPYSSSLFKNMGSGSHSQLRS